MDLAGKVVLVTGAARGIGKAMAIEFARRGADIIIAARSAEPRAGVPGTIAETASEIEALGRRVLGIHADVSIPADLERVAAEAVATFGQVHVLVNNAAVTGRLVYLGIDELSREQFEQAIAVNLLAPFTLTKLLARHMPAGGVVLNVTSGAAHFADPFDDTAGVWSPRITYGTTKAALDRMSNALARDLRPRGIACIAFDPGMTRTELLERALEGADEATRARSHPVSWPAQAAAFLCSCEDPMRYTGQVVRAEDIVREQGLA